MKRRMRKPKSSLVEMPMGPLIDMVFLLLVFFMVTSRTIRPEADIKMTLPGSVTQTASIDLPDEQRLRIDAQGRISLNEQVMDSAESRSLPTLVAVLSRFKQAADLSKTKTLVTLDPNDEVPHQRLVDVLGACAKAGITGVSFTHQSTMVNF